MTLPEALLKRLAKRGIISDAAKAGTNQQQAVSGSAPPAPASEEGSDREPGTGNNSDHSDRPESDEDEENVDEDGRRDGQVNNEEIIAEDYDEYDQPNPEAFEYTGRTKKANAAVDWSEKMKQKMTKRYGYQSVDGCQNKYNIFHLCTMYCVKRYGEVEFEIEKEYDKRVKRLLERFPLPKNWRKEYDIGCKAFYFYNKDTRIVSWLPPTHPDAKLTKSAKLLRRDLMEEQKQKDAAREATPQAVIVETYPPPASKAQLIGPTVANSSSASGIPLPPPAAIAENLKPPVVNPPKRPIKQPGSLRDEEKHPRSFSSGNDSGTGEGPTERESDREREYRDRNRDRRDRDRDRDRDRRDRDRSPPRGGGEDNRNYGRERERQRDHRDNHRHHHHRGRGGRMSKAAAPLDPMDPAAYSDIPRGNWSAGLESSAAAKKEKDERKATKQSTTNRADDEDDTGGSDGAHEVLKISAVKEFQQPEHDHAEEDDDGEETD
ncbi:hypothetical protein AND_000010 [Anopheles darlingi]|uniref:WW domain-containing protein n=1 Tax=Anopheles darlingi TaxID=43151 RepID=W5JXD6_ANODA|nr:hypothetical protein AND_000010 [Anopheles darlingi]